MKQERRVGKVAEDLARQPGAVGVVVAEQPKTTIQPATVFTGLQ